MGRISWPQYCGQYPGEGGYVVPEKDPPRSHIHPQEIPCPQRVTLSKSGNDDCYFDEAHSELLELMAGEEPYNSFATYSTLSGEDLTLSETIYT